MIFYNRLCGFLLACVCPWQRLASRLESEPTMLNSGDREDLQRTASYDGNVMQQIGALLLELGRATLSLRMGQSPVRF